MNRKEIEKRLATLSKMHEDVAASDHVLAARERELVEASAAGVEIDTAVKAVLAGKGIGDDLLVDPTPELARIRAKRDVNARVLAHIRDETRLLREQRGQLITTERAPAVRAKVERFAAALRALTDAADDLAGEWQALRAEGAQSMTNREIGAVRDFGSQAHGMKELAFCLERDYGVRVSDRIPRVYQSLMRRAG